MKPIFILILIVFLGSVLRLIAIHTMPPSLNWDEISHGWNAYSILQTERDEWGQLFPLANFRAYGDYPLPLNLYITIPFIAIFGLNEISIRLPHAILGILTIIASYFLASGVTRNKKIGLLVSLLVAIEPWFLFTSRFVAQANLSIFFLTAAGAAFFNREKNKYLLPVSFLFLGLTLFSYHTTRIFSPLLLMTALFIYRNEWVTVFRKEKVVFFLSVFVFTCFFLPLPFILANSEARARSQAVFLIDEGAVGKIIDSRKTSGLPQSLARLVYNKPTYFAHEFLKNYVDYFSPNFLFFKGGTQYQFSVPGYGLLYPVNLPFFYLGLFILAKQALKGNKDYRFVLVWLFLGAIPAALTTERFAVLRSTTMLPVPQILVGLGVWSAWNWWKIKSGRWRINKFLKFIPIALYFVVLAIAVENYLATYFGEYRKNYSWSWQYGYKEVVEYTKAHYNEYDKIIVTKKYGEPHEFFLFYWPWQPVKYREDPHLIRFYQSNWYWVDRFDKFYFVNDWDVPKMENGKWKMENGREIVIDGRTLLITSSGNYPPKWDLLKTVEFLDGKPAFDILERKQ